MAVTAVLQRATSHQLVYLVTSDGAGGSLLITSSGAATPDLATDTAAVNGPMKRIARAGLDGIGLIPAAGFDSQAKASALLQNLDPTSVLGNVTVPRATMICQGKTVDDAWLCTTGVSAGTPDVLIVHGAAAATAVLTIKTPHSTAI